MSKIKINKNDTFRTLLTELLPYEVPMLFSNEGFYIIAKSRDYKGILEKVRSLKKNKEFGIPYDYHIRKSTHSTRKLSIIHPLNQLDFIPFYEKYSSLLLYLCSKSPFSIRYPAQVAKYCYCPSLVIEEDKLKSEEVELEPEILDSETMLLKSYFSYKKYDLIYKFYDSYEYQRLEQRFVYMREFDIHKCFYSIYTHSITWAVKNKSSAKRYHCKTSFENDFDRLMQRSNYNETNGIIVGPEISRIFAEIILQQIDINVLMDIEKTFNKHGYKYNVDFEIRRYVDDYFIFANDIKVLDTVQDFFRHHLETYKLYPNIAKTQTKERPFLSTIAVAKYEIYQHFVNLRKMVLESSVDEEGKKTQILVKVVRPYFLSKGFIKKLQCIVVDNKVDYDVVCKDIVRYLKDLLSDVLKLESNNSKIENLFLMILDIGFFAYSMNMTASTTYKLAQIIILMCKYLKNKNDEALKHSVYLKIARDAEFAMTNYSRNSKTTITNIETLNLMIALKCLEGDSYLLSENKIREIFLLNNQTDIVNLSYFQIVTILYYIGAMPIYQELRTDIENAVVKKFENEIDPFGKAEFTCLFVDFICCPFVSDKSKKDIVKGSHYSTSLTLAVTEIQQAKRWFMDWDTNIDLERIIKKKEFGSSY